MTRIAALAFAVLVTAACSHSGTAASPASVAPSASPEAGGDGDVLVAPELDGGIAWLGSDRPLSLADLRGQVVVLDFWTYCCINCMHVLPELARVERQFADEPVVVIGVHSGKFDAEKDPKRIAAAMARHGVTHPVVVDSDFAIWNRYGVESWPTLVVIDPEGHVVGALAGEPRPGMLAAAVGKVVADARAAGTLAARRIALPKPAQVGGILAFPGKVAVASDGRIAIADSGHHRIVVTDASGERLDVAGSGMAGSLDGSFEAAAFQRPQGLAFDARGERLYVADTENHEIRRLDLVQRRVETVAGTGKKGGLDAGGPALETSLRSPWDLALDGDALYVAMAGSHQIWKLDLAAAEIAPFAGTGAESIVDGPLAEAAFSQPSGLALVGRKLYVADSEVSAVRVIDLDAGRVDTLVGTGLFDFGDIDGVGRDVRLQHALGVAAAGGALYVADTFNNKVKRLSPAERRVSSVAGGDSAVLFEPGGLAALPGGRLLVADSNNHRLRVLDPASGALSDFALRGVEPPPAAGLLVADEALPPPADAPVEELAATGPLGAGNGAIVVELEAPPGAELTRGAPVELAGTSGGGLAFGEPLRHKLDPAHPRLRLPVEVAPGATGPALLDVSYFYCRGGERAACLPVRRRLRVALDRPAGSVGGEVIVRPAAVPPAR